ncbi:uncharacterized protein LOC105829166 [Monomorium pharaonis]|uniref:uncharacterized protein LOC105829166 n=1 Tax=Monomorium pharaonis TaxID=307658 RepID=UPI0017479936|nr:uncharacterized protein LOC105829166 [Monomorium pharaonis]
MGRLRGLKDSGGGEAIEEEEEEEEEEQVRRWVGGGRQDFAAGLSFACNLQLRVQSRTSVTTEKKRG